MDESLVYYMRDGYTDGSNEKGTNFIEHVIELRCLAKPPDNYGNGYVNLADKLQTGFVYTDAPVTPESCAECPAKNRLIEGVSCSGLQPVPWWQVAHPYIDPKTGLTITETLEARATARPMNTPLTIGEWKPLGKVVPYVALDNFEEAVGRDQLPCKLAGQIFPSTEQVQTPL